MSKAALAKAQREARELRDGAFIALLKRYGIPKPEQEWAFAKDLKPRPRNWRFDFAWVEQKIALEVEGGAWANGRHNRGRGFVNDMDKYSAAAELGWRVIRITPAEMDDLRTVRRVATTLGFIQL